LAIDPVSVFAAPVVFMPTMVRVPVASLTKASAGTPFCDVAWTRTEPGLT